MNELFIKRMKELLKDDFDAFMNSLNENEVKGFYLNPLKKDVFLYIDDLNDLKILFLRILIKFFKFNFILKIHKNNKINFL